MPDQRPDYVMVQLTAAGKKLAGNAPLRVSNGRRSVEFKPDAPTEVERSYEWNGWLGRHAHIGGDVLFELVPAETTTE